MGKVLIQVGQSEEARVAAEAAAASGAAAPQLVLPRSNVPEDVKPIEEAPAASASEEASSDTTAPQPAPEVSLRRSPLHIALSVATSDENYQVLYSKQRSCAQHEGCRAAGMMLSAAVGPPLRHVHMCLRFLVALPGEVCQDWLLNQGV